MRTRLRPPPSDFWSETDCPLLRLIDMVWCPSSSEVRAVGGRLGADVDHVLLVGVTPVAHDRAEERGQDERDADEPGDDLVDVLADADQEDRRERTDRPVRAVLEVDVLG